MPSQQHAVRPRDREAGGRRSMLPLEPAAEAAVTRAGAPLFPAGAALDICAAGCRCSISTPRRPRSPFAAPAEGARRPLQRAASGSSCDLCEEAERGTVRTCPAERCLPLLLNDLRRFCASSSRRMSARRCMCRLNVALLRQDKGRRGARRWKAPR
ncbi:hypothetical protein FA09DRAFT_172377 [Tilletiopsis washingtonensis]|uniref:Uncharacterized protein n=1 Tax=Tilletiopsis washingtonensis TaxID=58919 RepID=A0A316YYY2_9BASI|nr:hypothetical protein FA09DRAFT_172377 [Tilletiopsis washingtonensis]PWN94670.1 hypothetical protein FA09DRAFT_172377 [Tilletiopsis washingtonensis]